MQELIDFVDSLPVKNFSIELYLRSDPQLRARLLAELGGFRASFRFVQFDGDKVDGLYMKSAIMNELLTRQANALV